MQAVAFGVILVPCLITLCYRHSRSPTLSIHRVCASHNPPLVTRNSRRQGTASGEMYLY